MKILRASILLGSLAVGTAVAADYSVGIVNLGGNGEYEPNAGLNLYSISDYGVELADGSPYVFPKTVPGSGRPYNPVAVAIDPPHEFVYVAYEGIPDLPIIIKFKITPQGLKYQWHREFSTGDSSLQGSTIRTESHYLVEYTYPDSFDLYINVVDEAGKQLVYDPGSNGSNVVSGHVDPNGRFYYSCRYLSSSYGPPRHPANAVAVYKLDKSVNEYTPPLLTSTDPVFVSSECR